MASQDHKLYLGVTRPITTAESSPREKQVTVTLMDELRRQESFESTQRAGIHDAVLGKVAALVKKSVYQVSILWDLSETTANAGGGKIFTVGSYRLGVHSPGSVTDVLCVVPKHVPRDDFFDVFGRMLKEMDGVTEVSSFPDAYIPVIKTEILGFRLDFTVARLGLSTIPDDLSLGDDNLLRNRDEYCLRSLNRSRVTDEILRLVPDVEIFQNSLRCIRLWAQRRAIYSDVCGFLGGVGWAILVAKICQLYPNVSAGAIVDRFFIIMHQWSWPQPVLLKPIENGPLLTRVWNAKLYPEDRLHRMPIITPAYPSTCVTQNVTASTQAIMKAEFKRASEIAERVIIGTGEWSELFKKHEFFHKYRYYQAIVVSTTNADLRFKWSNFVESKLWQLVLKFESIESVETAHPFTKGFNREVYCPTDEEVRAVCMGEIPPAATVRNKERRHGKEGRVVYTTTFYIGMAVEPKKPGQQGSRKLDLSSPANEFVEMAKTWHKYDHAAMGIMILNDKRSSLPDYVFDPGEKQKPALKRPIRSGKQKEGTNNLGM